MPDAQSDVESVPDADIDLDAMFPEPERPPSPEPSVVVYTREHSVDAVTGRGGDEWTSVTIRLVGSHPLWGHHLWNASRAFAGYLDAPAQRNLYRDTMHSRPRAVLELGAGGGLPGLVCALNGAHHVVLTDYPDAALVENLQYNVDINLGLNDGHRRGKVSVQGYTWGQPVAPLLALLAESHDQPKAESNTGKATDRGGFDLIILSDLVFNHSQHDALLTTCELALRRPDTLPMSPQTQNTDTTAPPQLLVFYTHHRPHLASQDMRFFEKARDRGWVCERVCERLFEPMFPDDPGPEDVRATVHGWRLTRP
ncbi:hypothetical protein PLICRDRAFT_529182 [Plicaturopsis crispa FD-325 SS-3]|nr:hypothetical protein PLICRDRAFT_529182 [Plicaturopsis crispa FD-325 SS-3]